MAKKQIEEMNKKELEKLLEELDLNIIDLFRIYTCMDKYDFDEFDYEIICDLIDDEIYAEYERKAQDLFDLEIRLIKLKKELKKYNVDTNILNKKIYDVKLQRQKQKSQSHSSSPSFLSLLFHALVTTDYTKPSKKSYMDDELEKEYLEYELFEDNEVEEDDFNSDDED